LGSRKPSLPRRLFLQRWAAALGGLSLSDLLATRLWAGLVDPATDPRSGEQRYLNAAPVGIDARWAWTQANGAGEGVGFVDIERGWFLAVDAATAMNQHEDLPAIGDRLRLSPNVPRDMDFNLCPSPSRHHGTAVVGVVAGTDNGVGIVGVAPNVASVEVVSHLVGGVPGNVDNAIDRVLPFMAAGDILLIEWNDARPGIPNLPAEVNDDTFKAIGRAIKKDVIVIEPAGNFNVNLDMIPDLNPGNATAFRDSGAIVVGACNMPDGQGNGRTRWVGKAADFPPSSAYPPFITNCNPSGLPPMFPGSNFGARVDCYAWGEGVVTAGYGWAGGSTPTNSYTNRFGGTSAAAPIVAGAAVLLQGLHKYIKGRPLTPAEMRTVLRTHGTSQQPAGATEKIGIMPDVRKAAEALFASSPAAPSNLRLIR